MFYKLFLTLLLFTGLAQAENIAIVSPYSATHAGTPAMLKIIEAANRSQSQYTFILEYKPGANGLLAVQAASQFPTTKLALIHAGYVDLLDEGKIHDHDWEPIWSLGSACWAVISNGGLDNDIAGVKNLSEIIAGGVGFGTAAHITAIMIGEKFNVPVRFITYKSAADVLIALASNNGPNLGLSPLQALDSFRTKNPNLRPLAMSCPQRHHQAPQLKTLAEQGIASPYIFNTLLANKTMSSFKQSTVSKILSEATDKVGLQEIVTISAMRPPQFDGISIADFHRATVTTQRELNNRYKQQIENHRQSR